MSRFLTVSLDTAKKHIKSASFWVMVLMPFILFIIMTVIGFISQSNKTPDTIAVVADDRYKKNFEENPLIKFNLKNNEDEAKKDLENKKISAYIQVRNDDGIIKLDYYGDTTQRSNILIIKSLAETIQNEENIKNANIDAKQKAILSQKVTINFHEIKDNLKSPLNMIALFGTIIIIYFVLIFYSQIMMTDIAVEKGSKMLEFIFSSVKAGTYMAGKIFGTLLSLLVHIGVYIVFALIGFIILKLTGIWDKLSQMIDMSDILKGVNYPLIAEIFLFMILGIVIFIILSAMLGSLVQKQEDAGKMSTPIMIIIVFAYLISTSFVGSEPNIFIKILSYIPFVSTFFMPMRLIYENASLMQGAISLLILFVGIILMYFIASRVYKKNILNYSTDKLFGRGKKLKLKNKDK